MSSIHEGIKQLRDTTGAKILDCRKALQECDGDIEKAVEWLRKHGVASAVKKQDRQTGQGVVAAFSKGSKGVLLEVNCETDFVARNEFFQSLVKELLEQAHEIFPVSLEVFHEKGVREKILEAVARIGENVVCTHLDGLEVPSGVVASYVHGAAGPGMGKIAVLVALESEGADKAQLMELGKKIAMHVAAINPAYCQISEVPEDVVKKEEDILRAQLQESGKPQEIVEKMIQGRLRKFFEECVLEQQPFVCDPSKTVQDVLKDAEKDLGSSIRLAAVRRLALGQSV